MEMIRRIASLEALPGLELRVTFDDGGRVLYDVTEDVGTISSYAPLKDVPGLFQQVRLDASRTCVY